MLLSVLMILCYVGMLHQGTFCPKGHALRRTNMEALCQSQNSPYSSGAQCEKCGRTITRCESLYHCDSCMFDVCEECSSKVRMTCPQCAKTSGQDMPLNSVIPEDSKLCSNCASPCSGSYSLQCSACSYVLCQKCHEQSVVCFKWITQCIITLHVSDTCDYVLFFSLILFDSGPTLQWK